MFRLFLTLVERPYSSQAFPPRLEPRSVSVDKHSRQSGDSSLICTKEQTVIVLTFAHVHTHTLFSVLGSRMKTRTCIVT